MKTTLPAISSIYVSPPATEIPPLRHGDRLTRAEFERRYEAMPDVKKAELLEGVVHMPSPVRFRQHGKPHLHLATWLGNYEAETPGAEAGDNASARLDMDNEPQPDAMMIVSPEAGGRTTIVDGYVEGGPEFVAEVSASTGRIDRKVKHEIYRRNGVREYLVWNVPKKKIEWFRLTARRYVPLAAITAPGVGEVHQSRVFPGLWLDANALVEGDLKRVLTVLDRGLASAEHAEFVASLAARSP